MNTEVFVFADWEAVKEPLLVGTLRASVTKNKEHFSFNYDKAWLASSFAQQIDPDLHFSSAMTQLGYYDGDYEASYLELAQFLTDQGSNTKQDIAQLWRRIVFNIAVSNTDDHLRNHGFIYKNNGWILSPAYDINPVASANGLHLNISDNDNSLSYDLAMEVIDFFQLKKSESQKIKDDVCNCVAPWRVVADKVGVGRADQEYMRVVFNV
ncbi:MAG: hypothetical protein COA42_17825 [Alteromonadaceae bacterium]|nr:MAG: hypothetical protein COA42_17825 [Alteromonadaceae bacterium]